MYMQLLSKLLNNIIGILIILIIIVGLSLLYTNRPVSEPVVQEVVELQEEEVVSQPLPAPKSLYLQSEVIGSSEEQEVDSEEEVSVLEDGVFGSDPIVFDGEDSELPEGFQPGVLLIPDEPAESLDGNTIVVEISEGEMNIDDFVGTRGEGFTIRFESLDDDYTAEVVGISLEELIVGGRRFTMSMFISEDFPDDTAEVIIRSAGQVVDTGILQIS